MSLTNKAITQAEPGTILRDTVVPGLHLRVFTNRKSYYLHYRTKVGRERRPKLEDHGILTLDQARRLARELLVKVAAGRDPVVERRVAKIAPTVADLATRYLKEHVIKKKIRSQKEDTRQINKYILPQLGSRRVAEVEYEDITRLHQGMQRVPYQANRVLALFSKMFTLAEKWRLRPSYTNPCRHVSPYTERKRQRYMTGTEAPKIAALLATEEAQHPQEVLFIYLLILSGARPDEIARARPEWIETRSLGGMLRLPDSKVGERTVFLPPQVMRLLLQARCSKGTLTGVKNPRVVWEKIRKEAGCLDLRLYDLRHTFASAALKAGYSLAQIGELLGHSSTQTTKRYAHLVDDSAQEAAADTATILEEMMSQPSRIDLKVLTTEHR